MRAPVYRHADAKSSVAGLSTNGLFGFLAISTAALQFLPFGTALLAVLGLYVAVRVLSYGRAPLYWQHRLTFLFRQRRSAGRLSAAARARTAPFPFR